MGTVGAGARYERFGISFAISEFALGITLDNQILARTVAAGEQVALAEVLELAASVRALYDTATLVSRDFNFVGECALLWQGVAAEFEKLLAAWEGVPTDGELISLHRQQLERLRDLSRDRVELYSLAGDRRRYLARRAADG